MSIEGIEGSCAEAVYSYAEIPVEENLFEQTVPSEEFTSPSDNLAMLRAEEQLMRGQKAQAPILRSLSPIQQKTLDSILAQPLSAARDDQLEGLIENVLNNVEEPGTNSDLLLQDLKLLLQYFESEERQSLNGWWIYGIQIFLEPEHVEKTVEEALSWISRREDTLTDVIILDQILLKFDSYGIFDTSESRNSLLKADELIQEFTDRERKS